MEQIRVLVADDHALIRGGIRALLEQVPELTIVGEASDGAEALQLIRQHRPNVALIDCRISRLNGFDVAAQAAKECPEVRVIILADRDDEEYLRRALSCGAAGLLVLTASEAELAHSVKSVANGGKFVTPSVTSLPEDTAQRGPVNQILERLTPRQREILQLIAEGNSTKEIAMLLGISVKTVESHRTLLTERLDIHDIAGLVLFAIKTGLVRLED